uniref:Histone-lysine N-methyltransferase SETMAR n=1 Tax=Caenorhabditis japonica TaxID=281687 RepID=A0A8R1HWP4_CAEJA
MWRKQQSHWTVLAHPPYSPDLAPTDYHLVPDMQRSLEGTVFKQKVMSKLGLCHILHQISQNLGGQVL